MNSSSKVSEVITATDCFQVNQTILNKDCCLKNLPIKLINCNLKLKICNYYHDGIGWLPCLIFKFEVMIMAYLKGEPESKIIIRGT